MKKVSLIFILAFLVIAAIGAFIPQKKVPPALPSSLPLASISLSPGIDHIVVIVMENKAQDDIIGDSSAPFLTSFANQNSFAQNYYAITHPSLPNYLAIIGADTFGVRSDCTNCYQNSQNLVDLLEKKQKTWKAYMESMPSPCFIGSSYPYAQKHNPFIYFDDIRTNSTRCQNIVPLTELNSDLNSPNPASFIWITPDLCHDMHDCSIKEGDDWLSQEVPAILDSPIFKNQNSILVVTFDEGESNDNRITTILAGPHIKKNFVSKNKYSHYSLLHTIEKVWSLDTINDNDKNSPTMDDFFN